MKTCFCLVSFLCFFRAQGSPVEEALELYDQSLQCEASLVSPHSLEDLWRSSTPDRIANQLSRFPTIKILTGNIPPKLGEPLIFASVEGRSGSDPTLGVRFYIFRSKAPSSIPPRPTHFQQFVLDQLNLSGIYRALDSGFDLAPPRNFHPFADVSPIRESSNYDAKMSWRTGIFWLATGNVTKAQFEFLVQALLRSDDELRQELRAIGY